MGGVATETGIRFQNKVVAWVYVHMLTQDRLEWFGDTADDVPEAVSGETDGPGDDFRIEFGRRFDTSEGQAKHGLRVKSGVDKAFARIIERSGEGDESPVVIVVGGIVDPRIDPELGEDLDRLRSGRDNPLRAEATRLRSKHKDSFLSRIHIARLDLDRDRDPATKAAKTMLKGLLADPAQAASAWGLLEADAGRVCAERRRRTRDELRVILERDGIKLRSPKPEESMVERLNGAGQLLKDGLITAAIRTLDRLARVMGQGEFSGESWALLRSLEASAALRNHQPEVALARAKQALEIDPKNVPALVAGANAALQLSQIELAKDMADKAVQLGPNDAAAWGARLRVNDLLGLPQPSVPESVATTCLYRQMQASLAAAHGDWQAVVSITADLVREGDDSVETVLLRGQGLLNIPLDDDAETNRKRFVEVEKSSTKVINRPGQPQAVLGFAFTTRGAARRRLGREADAEKDLNQARELNPKDESPIRLLVLSLVDRGRRDEAIALLRVAAGTDPGLLALRSTLRGSEGDRVGAKQDAEEAEARLSEASDETDARLKVAEAFTAIDDGDSAERVLAPVDPKQGGFRYPAALGSLALLRGNVEEAIDHFRTASAQAPKEESQAILITLGLELIRINKSAEAADVLEDAGGLDLPDGAKPSFAGALMAANRLQRAKDLVDNEAKRGPLPAWAVALAVNIALRAEDTDAAIERLRELALTPQSREAKIVLAKTLIDVGQIEAAAAEVDDLRGIEDLAPMDRIRVAELSHILGRHLQAVELAFRAFRGEPQNPQIQRSLAMLVFTCEEPIPAPTEVGPDTFVQLRGSNGELREHSIYAAGPIEPLRNELTVADAKKAGLLGHKVGDRIEDEANPNWANKGWVVESILAAPVHLARDITAHFGERFPSEPFFVTSVRVGDGSGVKDFVPLIEAVNARKEHVSRILQATREQRLPIGVAAKLIGASIPELMADPSIALQIEWPSPTDQRNSILAATSATKVALTISALTTAQSLGLLYELARRYTLIAPRSLDLEIRAFIGEAEQLVLKGQSTLLAAEDGRPSITELKPNDPRLIRRRDALVALSKWLTSFVSIQPRPLSYIGAPDSDDEQMRENIGHSSFDAVALACDAGAALYADDIGLRRIELRGTRPSSFSSITLLPALASEGSLTISRRDELLLKLIEANFSVVLPTIELLSSVACSPTATRAELNKAFTLLGYVAPQEAARMVGSVLKRHAVAKLASLAPKAIVETAVSAMANNLAPVLSARLVQQAARRELALLPLQLEPIDLACEELINAGK